MPTVLVTGAGRGLGLQFVRQYAAEGWTVLAACRAPERAEDVAAVAGAVERLVLDVTDPASVAALAAALINRPLDLLVNNAGIYGPRNQDVGTTDYAAWAEVLAVNLLGPMRMVEALLPNLERGAQKKIALVSSKMGCIADNQSGGDVIYRSSKAALNMLGKCLAIDLRGPGMTSVLLHPGWVRTDMGGPTAPLDAEASVAGMRKVIARATPADSGRFFSYDGTELPW